MNGFSETDFKWICMWIQRFLLLKIILCLNIISYPSGTVQRYFNYCNTVTTVSRRIILGKWCCGGLNLTVDTTKSERKRDVLQMVAVPKCIIKGQIKLRTTTSQQSNRDDDGHKRKSLDVRNRESPRRAIMKLDWFPIMFCKKERSIWG